MLVRCCLSMNLALKVKTQSRFELKKETGENIISAYQIKTALIRHVLLMPAGIVLVPTPTKTANNYYVLMHDKYLGSTW